MRPRYSSIEHGDGADLGDGFDDQHAWHDRVVREMALEKLVADRDVFDPDRAPAGFELDDAIDQQKRIAVRNDLLNIGGLEHDRAVCLSRHRSSPLPGLDSVPQATLRMPRHPSSGTSCSRSGPTPTIVTRAPIRARETRRSERLPEGRRAARARSFRASNRAPTEHRRNLGEKVFPRGQVVDGDLVQPVLRADLDLFEDIEHVEQRECDLGDAVETGDVPGGDRVEPSGSARTAGRRAVLAAALANRVAGLVEQLGRERAAANACAVRLVRPRSPV